MTRRQIEAELLRFTGGAITMNISDIARSRNKGRAWARELVKGLECEICGKSRDYYIKDIAQAMYDRLVQDG